MADREWCYTRVGALTGKRIWRLETESGYVATVERGMSTGWWYWYVVRGDTYWSGQESSREQATKRAEDVIWD